MVKYFINRMFRKVISVRFIRMSFIYPKTGNI